MTVAFLNIGDWPEGEGEEDGEGDGGDWTTTTGKQNSRWPRWVATPHPVAPGAPVGSQRPRTSLDRSSSLAGALWNSPKSWPELAVWAPNRAPVGAAAGAGAPLVAVLNTELLVAERFDADTAERKHRRKDREG